MPSIIRSHNDPQNTVTLNGRPVKRESQIFLPSHREWYPVLHTSMHFCFRDPDPSLRGTTLFCTCGAPAGIFGYEGYRKYGAWMGKEVVACTNLIQGGIHADGSHE